MKNILAFPILALALVLQMAVLSRLSLLSGAADLVLLVVAAWSLQERVDSSWQWSLLAGVIVGVASGLPLLVPVLGYLATTGLARLVLRRVWETPILAMFIVVFFGTLVYLTLALVWASLAGGNYPSEQAFSLIILPSVLLNIGLAIPVFLLVRDLATWMYPVEEIV
jgi:rod shape-determining protein MreD